MAIASTEPRHVRGAAWFLALSYGIGAPITAVAEFNGQVLSQRFDLPTELIYLTCLVQLVGAPAVLVRSLAPWAAVALTVVTIGAIGAHLSIGSPLTTVPALLYTAVQVWFGFKIRQARPPTA